MLGRDNGSDMTCQLHNVFGEWRSRSQDGRAELTTMFVQSLVEMRSDNTISPEKLPGQLMPGIRSNAQISNMLIQNWIAGAPTDDRSATAFLPFAGDLVACAMQDLPHSMSQMTHTNLAFANLTIERAMQHAMANFRSKLQPLFEPLGDGLFGCNNFADHQSALLLLAPERDYLLPKIDGTPVAVVPTRNLFYLTGKREQVRTGENAGYRPAGGPDAAFLLIRNSAMGWSSLERGSDCRRRLGRAPARDRAASIGSRL
jgi:hypothetical protein